MAADSPFEIAERRLRALAPTRRELLIRSGQLAAFLGLAGAGLSGPATAAGAELTWLQLEGISDPSFLTGFKDATIKTVGVVSESASAAQVAAGQVQGDVSLVSQAYGKNFWIKDDLVDKLDPATLPHWGDLYEYWQKNPLYRDPEGGLRSVANVWGSDSLINATDYIAKADSLAVLFDKKNAGKIAMPMNGVESVAVAAMYLGLKEPFNPSDDDLELIKKTLLDQKPLVRTYWETIGDLVNLFTSKEVTLAFGWLSVYTQVKNAGVPVAWAVPKEGQIGWSNGNAVLKGSTQKDLATKFVDYLISPEYFAPLFARLGYRTTSKAFTETLSEQQRTDLQLDDPEALLSALVPWITPPAELNRKIDDLWAEVVAT
jgi:spermidine/putrescine-binding protein